MNMGDCGGYLDEKVFRAQARDWLISNRPRAARPSDFAGQRAFDQAWQKCQFEGGWAGLAWPVEYGGRGVSLARQLIWYEEYAKARCPPVGDTCWLGLNHAGPTLMSMGSHEQQMLYLPAILKGEDLWCQGFSEPGAGSDLANIRTRGVIDGQHLVISGQKLWTSFAHLCDYQELLIRTDPESTRHSGLTWIIGDMRAEGVRVRPIMSLSGDYHNCEVFYDDVRVPLANVVGGIGDGWRVAMATLGFERATAGFGEMCELTVLVEDLVEYANTRSAISEELGGRLASLRADVQALNAFAQGTIARAASGNIPGAEGSIARLAQSELQQRAGRLAIDLLGPQGLNRSAHKAWVHYYLLAFSHTIAGGTSEIQRNIIGERVLGLPRHG